MEEQAKHWEAATKSSAGADADTETTGDDEVTTYEKFDAMDLKTEVLHGIYSYGFENPSAIQQKAIVAMCKNPPRDLIAQAQSGTGKTGAFVISMLQRIDTSAEGARRPQGLILAPTRELADQIGRCVKDLSVHTAVKVRTCVGGPPVVEDIRELRNGVHIVVGTPGRVYDLIERGELETTGIVLFVLDEADVMLNKGFEDQIKDIFSCLPASVQTGLFSATLTPECLDISRKFMQKPLSIQVKTDELTLQGINQFYVDCGRGGREMFSDKYGVLSDLYAEASIAKTVIFCNRQHTAEELTRRMEKDNFPVAMTHGGMKPDQRMSVMKEFRNNTIRVLVSTDLLARGIDVQQVSMVINFDIPRKDIETYLHRIGRSGRFGRKGVAINIASGLDDIDAIRRIERFYDTQIEPLPQDFAKLL